MQQSIAIIGAGYGDEGKGLATDFFCRQYPGSSDGSVSLAMVARGNGGAQAGHTVDDGETTHVFGHVGSGAMAGAETYLASRFIINPLVLDDELGKLHKKRISAKRSIWASPRCRVSTVFDMAINSLIELKRGATRHGSCGLGINETVERSRRGYAILMESVRNLPLHNLAAHIERIQKEWIPLRLKELGLPDGPETGEQEKYYSMFELTPINVAGGLQHYSKGIYLDSPAVYHKFELPLIIEGAQGLMLDEYLGTFPYVTRSVTGLPSAIYAAHECGKTEVQPVYMTRAYRTRHGAGPLTHEGIEVTTKPLDDRTNVYNQWQGTIRYAPLHLGELRQFIMDDLSRSLPVAEILDVAIKDPVIFVTCMDQLGDWVQVADPSGNLLKLPKERLIPFIEEMTGFPVAFASYGPTAKSVHTRGFVL